MLVPAALCAAASVHTTQKATNLANCSLEQSLTAQGGGRDWAWGCWNENKQLGTGHKNVAGSPDQSTSQPASSDDTAFYYQQFSIMNPPQILMVGTGFGAGFVYFVFCL